MTQAAQTTAPATPIAPDATPHRNGQVAPSWFERSAGSVATSPQPAPSQSAAGGQAQAQTTAQTPGNNATPVNSALIERTTAGLAVVIVIIFAAAWLLKRFGVARGARPELLKIIAARNVGNRERIMVVEIEDEWLVLGVASGRVNCLHRRPAGETPTDGPAATTRNGFADKLAARIAGGVRRKHPRHTP